MSAPVTLAAPTLAATSTAQAGTNATQPQRGGFSHLLAGQRRDAAQPVSAPEALMPDADPIADEAAAKSLLVDPSPCDVRSNKRDAARTDQEQDDLPPAPLAALTLDIAVQTAAQLRGAALRAHSQQTDNSQSVDTRATDLSYSARTDKRTPGHLVRLDATPGLQTDVNNRSIEGDNDGREPDHTGPGIAVSEPPGQAMDHVQRSFPRPSSTPVQAAATRQTNQTGKQLAVAFERAASDRLPSVIEAPRDAVTAPAATDATASTHANTHALPLPAAHAIAANAAASPIAHAAAMLPDRLHSTPVAPLLVAAPVGSPQWGPALGRQLITLGRHADSAGHSAELRLDPPDLGPLRVTLTLHDGVAHAAFASSHASVRQAVEAAMSQLQSALAQAGITLGQASVSDQQAPDQFASGHRFEQTSRQRSSHNGTQTANAATPANAPASVRTMRGDALVDTFA